MRIAEIAPLYESVPPKMYGGTERVVSYLTEELVAKGHKVTLFASGDSQTNAQLISVCSQGLRLNQECIDPLVYHILQLQEIIERAEEFDILHFHTDYLHFPVSRLKDYANVTTLHGRLDLPDLQPLYQKFSDMPLVSISNKQREPLPQGNWIKTIYHGLPADLYHFGNGSGNYLAFIGRISPEKRVDHAIEIAIRSGIPIRIAAKVDRVDQEYFEQKIKPLLDHPLVEFIGEISDQQKSDFLGNALATLFPIDWSEPFGLVMIESMACGTPVIGFRRGSVPEVIDEGISGFIVDNVDAAVKAVNDLCQLPRSFCRQKFEERFSIEIMAQHYVEVFSQLIENKKIYTGPSVRLSYN